MGREGQVETETRKTVLSELSALLYFAKGTDLNSTFSECHTFFLGNYANGPFGWAKVKERSTFDLEMFERLWLN